MDTVIAYVLGPFMGLFSSALLLYLGKRWKTKEEPQISVRSQVVKISGQLDKQYQARLADKDAVIVRQAGRISKQDERINELVERLLAGGGGKND